MKIKNFPIFKIFILFAVSAVFLASCGTPKESPEKVIKNFKEQATKIESGDILVSLSMSGVDNQDSVDFNTDFNIKFDHRNSKDRKADMQIAMNGAMKTAEEILDGDIDLNIRTIGDDYYVVLNKFESSYENMALIQPVIKMYTGKWLRIADSFIPDDIRQFQEKDEETLAKEKQLKKLFVDTELFKVVSESGIETLGGKKVYRYGIQLNESGIQEYIRKAAIIDGRSLTEAEIEEASKIISYFDNAEFWIGVKDYYLYKAVVNLKGGFTQQSADMSIKVEFEGADYNRSIKITTPPSAEEFNPIELLMAYSTLSMGIDDTHEADEFTEDEMMQIIEDIDMPETE